MYLVDVPLDIRTTNKLLMGYIGEIAYQDESSIIIEYIDIDTFKRLRVGYELPDDFVNGTLYVKDEEVNKIIKDYFKLTKKLNAINETLDTLKPDIDKETYNSLDEKRKKIKKELVQKEIEFTRKARWSKGNFVTKQKCQKSLFDCFYSTIPEYNTIIKIEKSINELNGHKFWKKSKLLNKRELLLHRVNYGLISLREHNNKYLKCCQTLAINPEIKFSIKWNGKDTYDNLVRTIGLFKTVSFKGHTLCYPTDFKITDKSPDYIEMENYYGYYIKLSYGENEYLKQIENKKGNIKTEFDDKSGLLVRVFSSWDNTEWVDKNYYKHKCFYLEEISNKNNGIKYSIIISAKLNVPDNRICIDDKVKELGEFFSSEYIEFERLGSTVDI